jgi:hypothetical protein
MTPKIVRLGAGRHGLETYGCKRTLQQLANRCRPAWHPQAEPEIVDSLQLIRVEHDLQPLRPHRMLRHSLMSRDAGL